MRPARLLHRDQRGVTMVEAAFVLPILFTMIFGLISYGLWEYQVTQATNAARDGARAGILTPGDSAAIDAAIASRLDGQPFTSMIRCTASCAAPVVDQDRITVTVQWQYDAPLVGNRIVIGRASMVILGHPS